MQNNKPRNVLTHDFASALGRGRVGVELIFGFVQRKFIFRLVQRKFIFGLVQRKFIFGLVSSRQIIPEVAERLVLIPFEKDKIKNLQLFRKITHFSTGSSINSIILSSDQVHNPPSPLVHLVYNLYPKLKHFTCTRIFKPVIIMLVIYLQPIAFRRGREIVNLIPIISYTCKTNKF